MNLPVYKSVGDFASLEPRTVSGLVPVLLGRGPSEELVMIATGPKGPVHYSVWPLADLYTQSGCDRVEATLATVPATGIWLIGCSTDLPNVAAAVAGLLELLDCSTKWSEGWRAIAITADGYQWGYVDDHIDATDPGELHAVPDLDPLWVQLAVLAVKAKCAKALEATALGLAPSEEDEEVLATESILARLRAHTPDGNKAIQGIADKASLLGALDAAGPVTVAEAINLGCALAASPELLETALERILTATPDRIGIGLWCQIARYTTGPTRSLAATLAGLAAWRTGDLATVCAAVDVAYPDRRQQPAARVLAELVWTGISADALMPAAPAAVEESDASEEHPPVAPRFPRNGLGEVA